MKSITEHLVCLSTASDSLKDELKIAIEIRDNYIYTAFNSGERQADIGMCTGLSTSTVKHIAECIAAGGLIYLLPTKGFLL